MTIKETADALGLKVRTIRDWIDKGKIRAVKRGKTWYISAADVYYNEEVQKRANEGRIHSRRIKESVQLGMREQSGQDTEKSVQRKKRQVKRSKNVGNI